MNSITLYSGPLSMFGAKAEIALREKGQDFELVMVPFAKGDRYEPRHPEVLRINPKRQVPVLVARRRGALRFHPDLRISGGRVSGAAALAARAAARAEARLLELKADEIVFMNIARLFGLEETPDDPVAVDARAKAYEHYAEMEARLAGRDYLAGHVHLRRHRLLHGAVLRRAERRGDERGDAAAPRLAGAGARAAGGAHRDRADGRVAPLGGTRVAGLSRGGGG